MSCVSRFFRSCVHAAVPPVLVLGLIIPTAFAESGLEIMTRVDAQEEPPVMAADMTMTLIDSKGNQRIRRLRSLSRTGESADRQRLFFLAPADVRGTGFLMVDYHDAGRADDQWLFLPGLNKSKRIAGSDQSSSFMGSDLSYADMASRNLEDWTYDLVGEDRVGNQAVWLVRAKAAHEGVSRTTGYTESLLYVQQSNYRVIRAIHTQVGANERKLLNVPEWTEHDGYWVPEVIQMASQEGGRTVHRTQLTFSNIDLDVDVPSAEFSIQRLEQGL